MPVMTSVSTEWLDSAVIEAYKKGDRVGATFEGKGMWLEMLEDRIKAALCNVQGTDESSIVDCFLGYVQCFPWEGQLDQWLWGWLVYHRQHHGIGYGRTYRNHFNLVSCLEKKRHSIPLDEKLAIIRRIADEEDSFGNGCLALVYPLYAYARAHIPEYHPRELVMLVTCHTHSSGNALRAVTLLMDYIDGLPIEPPSEEEVRVKHYAAYATAWNTMMAAFFIADVATVEELYRRGIHVGGDADSTIATAALLWQLGRHRAKTCDAG